VRVTKRTNIAVVALCGFMMIAEIIGGLLFGSIALAARPNDFDRLNCGSA
jgi:Co/Zn/Cd efflux system component